MIKLGQQIFKEIPQLEVINNEGRDTQNIYYLSPFRAYGFQVSGTDTGIGSYGVSEFIGLTHIVRANQERIAKAIFRAMALNALMDHTRRNPKPYYPSFEDNKVLDKFIDASYDWVKSIVDEETQQRGLFDGIKLPEEKTGMVEQLKSKAVQLKSKVWKTKQA